MYTQQLKKRENFLLLNGLKIKYVDFKNCVLHIKGYSIQLVLHVIHIS